MMKKLGALALVTACIVALVAIVPVPQAQAGENILANGEITLAAGATNATQTIGLYNIKGQEWGEIYGFRIYNGGTNYANVTVTCEDFDAPITLFQKDATLTNVPGQVAAATVYAAAGSTTYARTVKIRLDLVSGQTNITAAVKWPWKIYAK